MLAGLWGGQNYLNLTMAGIVKKALLDVQVGRIGYFSERNRCH